MRQTQCESDDKKLTYFFFHFILCQSKIVTLISSVILLEEEWKDENLQCIAMDVRLVSSSSSSSKAAGEPRWVCVIAWLTRGEYVKLSNSFIKTLTINNWILCVFFFFFFSRINNRKQPWSCQVRQRWDGNCNLWINFNAVEAARCWCLFLHVLTLGWVFS